MAITPGPAVEMTAQIPLGERTVSATLLLPPAPAGLVLFPHTAGDKLCARIDAGLARAVYDLGLGSLRCDLLADGEAVPRAGSDLPKLARRLVGVTAWLGGLRSCTGLPVGYVAWNLGATVALIAAPLAGARVRAIVALDGRLDLADDALLRAAPPTLLIVTGPDAHRLELNYRALAKLPHDKELAIIGVRGPLLEAPRALEQIKWFMSGWAKRYVGGGAPRSAAVYGRSSIGSHG